MLEWAQEEVLLLGRGKCKVELAVCFCDELANAGGV
jgi:hypothetical protein